MSTMGTARMLCACQRAASDLMLQPSRTKLLIRLGNQYFFGSGKATTRAQRRITSRVEGTGPSNRFPTRSFRGNSAAPLKLAEA